MENENKVVALSQKNLLAKVNSSIGITNKLIAVPPCTAKSLIL